MKLIPATTSAADAKRVMRWRNEPSVLSQSFHPKPKVWPEFYEEWRERYFAGGYLGRYFREVGFQYTYFMVEGRRKVGLIRFRLTEGMMDLSVMVDKPLRGRGYARDGVRQAVQLCHSAGFHLLAEVFPKNAASRKLFRSMGEFRYEGTFWHKVDDGRRVRVMKFISYCPREKKVELTKTDWNVTKAD